LGERGGLGGVGEEGLRECKYETMETELAKVRRHRQGEGEIHRHRHRHHHGHVQQESKNRMGIRRRRRRSRWMQERREHGAGGWACRKGGGWGMKRGGRVTVRIRWKKRRGWKRKKWLGRRQWGSWTIGRGAGGIRGRLT